MLVWSILARKAKAEVLWSILIVSAFQVLSGHELIRLLLIVYGLTMVVLEQKTMMILNIIMLAVGPVLVGVMIFFLQGKKKLNWSKDGWFRFPLALLFGVAATMALAFVYAKFSPLVSSSQRLSLT